jgi:hypothetical protein
MNNRQPTSFGKSGLTVGQFMLRIGAEQSDKKRTDKEIIKLFTEEFGRELRTECHRIVAYWIGRYNAGSLPGQSGPPRIKAYRYDTNGNPFIRKCGPKSKSD